MRLGIVILCAASILGCDLVRAPGTGTLAQVAATTAPAVPTFETLGTIRPDGTVTGEAGLAKDRSLDGSTPSPSPSPSPSATTPPSFTPTAAPTTAAPIVTAAPTTAAPTTSAPTATPAPTPSPSPTATPMAITSFTPASGPPGTNVYITGTNLTGATSARFGGVSASLTSVTATTVVAIVPVNAISGPIELVAGTTTARSITSFIVTAPPPTPGPNGR
jgi:hypothetical protein